MPNGASITSSTTGAPTARSSRHPDLAGLKKPYAVMRGGPGPLQPRHRLQPLPVRHGRRLEVGRSEVGGNCWRTTGDISDSWGSMSGIGFGQNGHERYAGPGPLERSRTCSWWARSAGGRRCTPRTSSPTSR